jgi:hypothetical protein
VSNAPGQLGFQLPPLQHLLIHLALELHHLADAKVGIVGTLRGYKWYRNGIYIWYDTRKILKMSSFCTTGNVFMGYDMVLLWEMNGTFMGFRIWLNLHLGLVWVLVCSNGIVDRKIVI